MLKNLIKRWMPDHHTIKTNKHLQIFGDLLHNPNLWHLNRNSISKAFAVGLFCAFIPIPFQMVLAAAFAIIVHANLPLSIALVWISNPITMPPIFYFCYLIGTWILNTPAQHFNFQLSWSWIIESVSTIGPSFLLGCVVMATFFSVIGYVTIQGLWRYNTVKTWKKRNLRKSDD